MLAGIAEGDTRLENFSTGADCASTLGCVRSLGVEVERNAGSVVIHGRGAKLAAPAAPLCEILEALLVSPLGDSKWLLEYWSRERLFSVEARRGWLPPDLKPLPY